MTSTPVPPSFPERLLRASVRDPEWRDAVSGDLREEFAAVARARGAATARWWYWRQTLPLAARFLAGRVVPSATPARHRLTVAEIEAGSTLGRGWSREWRQAWRSVWQRPALSATIVATLALALTANAVVFSLADALYLRPFRFPDVDRLILVTSDTTLDSPYLDRESVAAADFRDWQRSATTVSALAAASFWDPNLSGVDVPEQLPGFRVTAGFFELLGARPVLGRTFTGDEAAAGGPRVAVLSHAAWLRRFNGEPGILGRTLRLDGETFEIVGVMPPRFAIPYGAEVWAPLALTDGQWTDRRAGDLMVIGRLADGRRLEDARGEFQALAARLSTAFPETNRQRGATVLSFSRGLGDDAVGPLLAIWQSAALMVLLIACANIANLLLARATERQAEFDVRLALGASRVRLVRQLLVEGACLAALGVTVGSVLTYAAMITAKDILPASVVRFVPGYEYLRLDVTALAALAALGALATVGFALLPALQATRSAAASGLARGTRSATAPPGRQWLRSTLAVAQVALTLALVVAATLVVRGVSRATDGALGFDKQGLLVADLTLPERPYAEGARRIAFGRAVLESLSANPGIEAAALASTVPYATGYATRPFLREGDADTDARRETRTTDLFRVSPEYFRAMRIPHVAGRPLSDGDGPDAPRVALVTRALVDQHFGGADPLGRRFRLANDGPWITVVGVVDDVIQDWLSGRRSPTVYLPIAQDPPLHLTIVARSTGVPEAMSPAMRRAVAAGDPDQPILKLASMTTVIADRLAGLDYFAKILTGMGLVALVLALGGMYSLMAYLAARRTREMGVRVALGATPGQVTWLGVSRALAITGAGLVAGALLAGLIARTMQAALFGLVTPAPVVMFGATAGLALVAITAGYLPARRAAARDPWLALRADGH